MSQDQKPGKVKLYSGGGAKPGGVRAVSGGSGAQRKANAAAPAQVAALPAPEDAQGSGTGWLIVLLFVLGCAIGGGLFTAFVPL
jgi:hypothetical protein